MWAARGHHVKFVSLTNGDVGHWKMSGGALAKRRSAEVERAAKILGVTTQVLDIHDGELMPTLENRKTVIRLIRQWNADVVIGHRPNDYHPDHRYTGVLMQDAAYMTGVPHLCPDTPALKKSPLFLYSYDTFKRPNPFRADVVVAIDSVIEKKVAALAEIESQFIEGGCNGGPDLMPRSEAEREAAAERVKARFKKRFARIADRCRERLIALYGAGLGAKVRYAEAFEICEYGRQPSEEELREIFPFFPGDD
jgi:LmbE family N-acetylglucosaminyl deacetylase